MLLIDEYSEPKLLATLEALKEDPKISRCIYARLGTPASNSMKEMLFELAQRHLQAIDAQIFICGDGDIFILAPHIPIKDGKEFILSLVNYVNKPATDDWIGFYEISLHSNKLIANVQEKLDRQRKSEEERLQKIEQLQQERKRHAILNGASTTSAADIFNRRNQRSQPAIMMIEDDAFSRRLVENVLQKQFLLTGLGDATNALDTYSRIAPDLLFLDINLPDVTGHELLEKILKLDPNAYVVMLSGNADKDNITQAMSKGAKGFIAKPFTKEKLFQYIDRCPTIAHQTTH